MKLLLDMNLSPAWGAVFSAQGWEARHWMNVGAATAMDSEIMEWARVEGYVVVTHDLDFSAILAATQARAPSVIQLRGQDIVPGVVGDMLISIIRRYNGMLARGAILTVDLPRSRIRMLPLE